MRSRFGQSAAQNLARRFISRLLAHIDGHPMPRKTRSIIRAQFRQRLVDMQFVSILQIENAGRNQNSLYPRAKKRRIDAK